MKLQCSQPGSAGSVSVIEPADLRLGHETRHPTWLALETVLVAITTLAAIKALNVQRAQNMRWILIPGLLVAAALVPTWIARREFPRIGLDAKHLGLGLGAACRAGVLILPLVFLGLWIATRLGLPIPLQPAMAGQDDWLSWLLYQFLYVAVAEEVFFRGYLQANVARLLDRRPWGSWRLRQSIIIFISAACFALAHVIVQGRMIAFSTFLPGLLLAWLFVRTRLLLAPILFHGVANVTYGIMALTLA